MKCKLDFCKNEVDKEIHPTLCLRCENNIYDAYLEAEEFEKEQGN